jgi:GntR family transcriptional regulator
VFFSELLPVIHCINTVPISLILPEFVHRACELYRTVESTYQFVDKYCQMRVHHQRSEIRAVPADEAMASQLKVESGAPLLRVEEVAYSPEVQPVFYGLNHFRGDMVSFEQLRRPALNIAPEPLAINGS